MRAIISETLKSMSLFGKPATIYTYKKILCYLLQEKSYLSKGV